MSIVELRRYTLKPGARDVLIDLFEAELLEPQEQCGMRIVGTFRDLDDPDRFVWLRAFPDMEARTEALEGFYRGPVWRRHRDAANATMVDSDDVLLLRPAWEGSDFAPATGRHPDAAADGDDRGSITVTIVPVHGPPDLGYFSDEVVPALRAHGGTVHACLVTEHSQNGFPALPVRDDVDVVAWCTGYPGRAQAEIDAVEPRLLSVCAGWPSTAGPIETLRLRPTSRSSLV